MEVKLLGEKRAIVIMVTGELDHHLAARVKEEADIKMRCSNAVNVIFDFSEVSFMDSSGIGVIMGRYKKARMLGGKVVAYGVSTQILRLMEMSGIDKIIRLAPTYEKALRLLDK